MTSREGLIFSEAVVVENESGVQVFANAIISDPFDRAQGAKEQIRIFRFLNTVTINRNYKIIQTTNSETATWWVKELRDDKEGSLYATCVRPIAKG